MRRISDGSGSGNSEGNIGSGWRGPGFSRVVNNTGGQVTMNVRLPCRARGGRGGRGDRMEVGDVLEDRSSTANQKGKVEVQIEGAGKGEGQGEGEEGVGEFRKQMGTVVILKVEGEEKGLRTVKVVSKFTVLDPFREQRKIKRWKWSWKWERG